MQRDEAEEYSQHGHGASAASPCGGARSGLGCGGGVSIAVAAASAAAAHAAAASASATEPAECGYAPHATHVALQRVSAAVAVALSDGASTSAVSSDKRQRRSTSGARHSAFEPRADEADGGAPRASPDRALARASLLHMLTLFFDVVSAELLYSQGSKLACVLALGCAALQFYVSFARTRAFVAALMGGRARKPAFIRAFLRCGPFGVLGLDQLLLLDSLGLLAINDVDLGDLAELLPIYRPARLLVSAALHSLPLLTWHCGFALSQWRVGGMRAVSLLRPGARGWALSAACALDAHAVLTSAWRLRAAAAQLSVRARAYALDVAAMRDGPPLHALFTHLVSTYTPSSSHELDVPTRRHLCIALGANRSLRTLNLSLCQIADYELERLAPAVRHNPRLHSLQLGRNQISDDGACILASHLRLSDGLADLRLWDNLIGDLGCAALADALCRNSSLRSLTLYGNRIADEGAAALAAALAVNTSLTSLGLSVNLIGDPGGLALAAALSRNGTLREINLAYNAIGDDGACAFAAHIGQNCALLELGLWCARVREVSPAVVHTASAHAAAPDRCGAARARERRARTQGQ